MGKPQTIKTTAAKAKEKKPTSRRLSTNIAITAKTKDMMLPRIHAVEAIETSLGGAEGPDEKWIIITMPQTVIVSKMQVRTETDAVL
jgi:hypothetical protein